MASLLTTAICVVTSIWCVAANFTLSSSTLPRPMFQHFAGVFDNKLTVFAGKEGSTPITTSHTALIQIGLDTLEWNANNFTLPSGATRFDEYSSECSVAVDGDVYIVNPFAQGGTATVYHGLFAYSLASHQFTVLPSPPHKAWGLCTVYSDESKILYAIGGYSGGHLRYTQRFNVTAKQWMQNGANIEIAVYHPGCSMDRMEEKIFVFGGDYGGKYTDRIQKYMISDNVWTVINATASVPRIDPKCRVLRGSIYCVGGLDGDAATLRTVDIFDSVSETVTNTIQLNVPRWEFTATVWNDGECLIITGGVGLNSIESMGDCIAPTAPPTNNPTLATENPTVAPSNNPSIAPSKNPTVGPSKNPTVAPSNNPTIAPSNNPTSNTDHPTAVPSADPTTKAPTTDPTKQPSDEETVSSDSSPTYAISLILLCIISIACING